MSTAASLRRTISFVNWVLLIVACFFLSAMVISVVYGIATRAFGWGSPNWIFDLSILLMLPLTYLVAGPVAERKGHVAIDLVVDALPKKWGRYLEQAGQLVVLLFLAYATYHAFVRLTEVYASGIVTGSAFIPHWPFVIAVPLGFAALTFEYFLQFLGLDSDLRKETGGTL